jgi:4-amino-4-deoxy-L-arabinose transferase-like glycosyltransferase
MAVIDVTTHPDQQYVTEKRIPIRASSLGYKTSWWMMWGCLFCACIGAAWFSYQYFLVPQPRSFAPDWHMASWIQASDGAAPVAYFRSAITLGGVPDQARITLGASQTFRLYVNNTFIGSNEKDFLAGDTLRPYVYDVTSTLVVGPNLVTIRVANLDKHTPALRAALHITTATFASDDDTGSQWQATANSQLVFPRLAIAAPNWDPADFGLHPWPTPHILANGPVLSPLPIDPALYQRPLPSQWITAGAQTQGYYVRQLYVTGSLANAWIRFTAAGPAEIFVNGDPVVYWDGTPPGKDSHLLGLQYTNVHSRRHSSMVGVYDIAPYLHTGQNTLAVYVSAPDNVTLLGSTGTSLSLEVMLRDKGGNDTWSTSRYDWHVSASFAPGWQQGGNAALAWPAPVQVPRPLSYKGFYMPDSEALLSSISSLRNLQSLPVLVTVTVVLASVIAVLLVWLLMAFILGKRYYGSLRNAMPVMSLAFVPALALEVLLLVLGREPLFLQPFPYNTFWGLVLIMLVIVTYLLLWLQAFLRQRSLADSSPASPTRASQGSWFRRHWTVLPLVIVASVLVFPSLQYEPYWQDELATYFAAKGSIAHGFPQMITGFIYPKAELFHYMLGMVMVIFGDQNGIPRLLTTIEYLVTIPLLYAIGTRFFNRRVGWLAAAMLTLSPYAMIWSVQERMYQQAQLCVLVMLFVFYIAVRKPNSLRWPYIAVGCLLLTYLSHEEIFITLPAVVLGVFWLSKSPKRVLPDVFYQKHWWFAALIGVCVIGSQLLIVKFSHPPFLGTDQSMRSEVQLHEDGTVFYYQVLFAPNPSRPWITLNSLLAFVGCIYAVRSHNKRLKYCAMFLVLSTLTLVFVFTMRAERYFYPIMPVYYLVGAYALLHILQSIWRFAHSHKILIRRDVELSTSATRLASSPLRWLALLSGVLICGSVLIAPLCPISNNSVTLSHSLGGSYHQQFLDYDVVAQYIKQHKQPGDIVISITPDLEMSYYLGYSDYYLSVNRALFLMERNNHLINTSSGATALLNQRDLDAVLSLHPRVWLVSDHAGYELSAFRRFTVPNSFHVVCEGARTVLYLRGD